MGEKGGPERRSQYGRMGGIPGRGASGPWVKRVKMFKGKQGKGKEVQRIIGNPLVCTRHHA